MDIVRNIYEIFEIMVVVFLFLAISSGILALADPSFPYVKILSEQTKHLSYLSEGEDASLKIGTKKDVEISQKNNIVEVGVKDGASVTTNISRGVSVNDNSEGLEIN